MRYMEKAKDLIMKALDCHTSACDRTNHFLLGNLSICSFRKSQRRLDGAKIA